MSLTQKFEKYLTEELKISKNTLKFYKSDLGHFASWLLSKLRGSGSLVNELDEAAPYINTENARQYLEHLQGAGATNKTINRRLSTLRNFSRFLVSQNISEYGFMDNVGNLVIDRNSKKEKNVTPILEEFQAHLSSHNKYSRNTIKNYTNDVRQFLSWMEKY